MIKNIVENYRIIEATVAEYAWQIGTLHRGINEVTYEVRMESARMENRMNKKIEAEANDGSSR